MHTEAATGRCDQCGEPGNSRTLHSWHIHGTWRLLCYDVQACTARQERRHRRAARPWFLRWLR